MKFGKQDRFQGNSNKQQYATLIFIKSQQNQIPRTY